MKNEGLLKDLGLKKGDVVELIGGLHSVDLAYYKGILWIVDDKASRVNYNTPGKNGGNIIESCNWIYRVVSRAAPRSWKDLTPEEKGALLLAHHEGRKVQHFNKREQVWEDRGQGLLLVVDDAIYRIKPKPIVETVKWKDYIITFNTVDEIPDLDSIKMEK